MCGYQITRLRAHLLILPVDRRRSKFTFITTELPPQSRVTPLSVTCTQFTLTDPTIFMTGFYFPLSCSIKNEQPGSIKSPAKFNTTATDAVD
jgi:hypothetical protein